MLYSIAFLFQKSIIYVISISGAINTIMTFINPETFDVIGKIDLQTLPFNSDFYQFDDEMTIFMSTMGVLYVLKGPSVIS